MPLLSLQTTPSSQQGETDFPVTVEVRVEADRPPACGPQRHLRGRFGVRAGKHDIEQEASPGIRSSFRPGNRKRLSVKVFRNVSLKSWALRANESSMPFN